jgi:hypothetical protein
MIDGYHEFKAVNIEQNSTLVDLDYKDVSVLFARSDSVYKNMGGVDVWDIGRDARNYAGHNPVIAHPPCRAWGQLSHFAKPRPDEKDLAFFAVDQVRRCGGVLEHPRASRLWDAAGLPKTGFDKYGGWTLPIYQSWFGHRADKATLLYIVGVRPVDVPVFHLMLGESSHVVTSSKRINGRLHRPEISKAEREHTPVDLAVWMVQLCRGIDRG